MEGEGWDGMDMEDKHQKRGNVAGTRDSYRKERRQRERESHRLEMEEILNCSGVETGGSTIRTAGAVTYHVSSASHSLLDPFQAAMPICCCHRPEWLQQQMGEVAYTAHCGTYNTALPPCSYAAGFK